MKNLSIALAMAASMLALSAHAGPTSDKEANSVEVGYGTYTEKIGNMKINQDVVRVVVDIPLDKTFATEIHLATGVGPVEYKLGNVRGSTREASLDYVLGGFVKAKTPVTQSLSVFGRAGVVNVQASSYGYSSSITNFAYGVGAEYAFNKNTALTVDYTNFNAKSGSANIMVAGLKFKF